MKLEFERPVVSPSFSTLKYCLEENLVIRLDGHSYIIPSGFEAECSIPRVFWSFIATPFHPQVMTAAIIHDWLYQSHRLTRKQSDSIFVFICKSHNVSMWRVMLMYWALRLFGWKAWKTKR